MEQPFQQERTAVVVAPGTQVAERPAPPPVRPGLGRLGALLIAILCGAVVGGAIVYFLFERPALEAAQARAQAYEQELISVRGQLMQANSLVAALEGRLQVEESTRRGLETVMSALQGDLGKAQDSLAFYEQLIPPGPQGAVTIRALDFERIGPHLSYRLLLMRSGSNDKPFQGSLQFMAQGSAAGEEVSVPLFTATKQAEGEGSGDSGTDSIPLEFSDFQRNSGLLRLPPGLELKSVTLNVLEGDTLRTSRSVELPAAD